MTGRCPESADDQDSEVVGDPSLVTGLTELNGGPASVRAAHSVNLQAEISSVRHVVRPHVILWEDGVRSMPDAQRQLVDDEIGVVRHVKAVLALVDPPPRCRRNPLHVRGPGMVRARGSSVPDR